MYNDSTKFGASQTDNLCRTFEQETQYDMEICTGADLEDLRFFPVDNKLSYCRFH